jgi:hypothetical protein
LRVASAVEPCAAGIGQGFVGFDDDGEVQFDVLGGNGFDGGEQAMAIWSVANWARGYASETDLIEKIEFAVGLEAAVEQMRGVRETRGAAVRGVALPEEGLHYVHYAAEEMGAAGYSGGADGAEDGARRDADVNEVVETVVHDGMGVVDREELGRGWLVRVL